MTHKGMKFGIFLAPFHRIGENPTLALSRDMELIEWLDYLGYDEGGGGEDHPGGVGVDGVAGNFICGGGGGCSAGAGGGGPRRRKSPSGRPPSARPTSCWAGG